MIRALREDKIFSRRAHALLVVIADEDLEQDLVTVDRIRELDQRVRIVARAFDDAAAAVLAQKPFECIVVSTSRHAVESLLREGAFRRAGVAPAGTTSPRTPTPASDTVAA